MLLHRKQFIVSALKASFHEPAINNYESAVCENMGAIKLNLHKYFHGSDIIHTFVPYKCVFSYKEDTLFN